MEGSKYFCCVEQLNFISLLLLEEIVGNTVQQKPDGNTYYGAFLVLMITQRA